MCKSECVNEYVKGKNYLKHKLNAVPSLDREEETAKSHGLDLVLETDVRGWELFTSTRTFASQLSICVFSWFCCCLSGRIWVRNTLNSCRVSFWGWNSGVNRSVHYKALTALTLWLISDLYDVANKAFVSDTEGKYFNKIVFC